jgi:RNA polymerase primary sigma factor
MLDKDTSRAYYKDINKYPLLGRKEEFDYIRRAKKGDSEALHKLVCCNQRFVLSVAQSFSGQGLDTLELVNEGTIGLIRSVKTYSLKSNVRFLSYAVWWIRQSIVKAIYEKVRVVRAPFNRMSLLFHYKKKLQGVVSDKVAMRKLKVTQKELDEIKMLSDNMLSMDTPLAGSEDRVFGDTVLVASEDSDAEISVEKKYLCIYIKEAIKKMPYLDAEIVSGYFGIGDSVMTLEDLSKKEGVTRECIRQRKDKALKKLKMLLIPYGGKRLLECF